MLPYGVGADSISARAIWGNAKPHGARPYNALFRQSGLPFEGSSRTAGEGWPDATPTPPKKEKPL